MSTDLANRPLVTLCRTQHFQVLELLQQLISLGEDPAVREERLEIVQQLRQRLSRHIQLMRHGFYPSLREQASADEMFERKISQFEEAMTTLLPTVIGFLHQAERNPEQGYPKQCQLLHQKLSAHFEKEQKQLHVLFARHVPLKREEWHLKVFRKRLEVTVSQDPNYTGPIQPPSRRPTVEELDRQAITRPVRPGESIWGPPPEAHMGGEIRLAT